MPIRYLLLGLGIAGAFAGQVRADDVTVTWTDPSCGFFVGQLPEGEPADAFGLFSWKVNPGPQAGDILEGNDMVAGQDVEVVNKRNGDKYTLIHWANAKAPEMLIRNTPVQCRNKWKKKN